LPIIAECPAGVATRARIGVSFAGVPARKPGGPATLTLAASILERVIGQLLQGAHVVA